MMLPLGVVLGVVVVFALAFGLAALMVNGAAKEHDRYVREKNPPCV